MIKRLTKYGKIVLSSLYAIYLIIIIVNIVFALDEITNPLIESTEILGYIITYGLEILITSGFFVIPTITQLIVYHVKKKSVSKSLIPLIIFEIIKILGTALYISIIDYANIHYGGVVTAFIILRMIVFVIVSAFEIALMTLLKRAEKLEVAN